MLYKSLLEKLAKKLDQSRIPYMIIGGQAVMIYGEPRFTGDIDITLGIQTAELDKIVKIVKDLKLKIQSKATADFVKRTMVLPAVEDKTGIRVDLIFSFSPFERQAIKRAKIKRIGQTPVYFASLEDLVIHKMVAGRPRDLEDVRTILLKNRKHDLKYIELWLRQFDQALHGNYWETYLKLKKESLK